MPEAAYSYTIHAAVTLHPPLQHAIDEWRAKQVNLSSRSESIRQLIVLGLEASGEQLSDSYFRPEDNARPAVDGIDLRNRPDLALPRKIHVTLEQSGRISRFATDNRLASESLAIYHLIKIAFETLDAEDHDRAPQPLRLPPPAPKPLSLIELAALIRETAETNPFVRPLADLLEGKL